MGVSIPKLGWTEACAVVLGDAGPGYGLSLFRSLRDYLTRSTSRYAVITETPAARASSEASW